MSLGLPSSWLNFRAWSKAVLRFVYWQQKKHLLLRLPFFLRCSTNTSEQAGAPHSKIKACLLTRVKKLSAFRCHFPRVIQGSGQRSARRLWMCSHSFLQLRVATPIPLGLGSRARTRCQPTALQPAAGLLSLSRHGASPTLPSSSLGSREETATPINHKSCWLNPSCYFTLLQPGVKAVPQTALFCEPAARLCTQTRGKNWVFIYMEFAVGPGFSTCTQPRPDMAKREICHSDGKLPPSPEGAC